ncbi:MAG: hypothetical protein NWE98_01620 [Candidatus Bathyarchaeota archaeon]|nr:hypothetical protein [Candidatus Bathyarchaeota archaeon]
MVNQNPYLIVIPPRYVIALLKLHEKLEGKSIDWAVSGDLAEALRTVKLEPDCIEIVTSKEGANQIHSAVEAFNPEKVAYRVQRLPRDALIKDKEYPVYVRSHYFEFDVEGVKVKVHGGLQFKVDDWDWGDKFEFTPDTVYIVNKKTYVVPLSVKYEMYQRLGWTDRAEKIKRQMNIIASAYKTKTKNRSFF